MSADGGSGLERALRRDRAFVLAGLGGAVALAWAWLVPAAVDMYGAMDGLSAWMMRADWDGRYFALMAGMWSVMMLGMMLPSAAPTLLVFGAVVRRQPQPDRPVARVYAFAAGYLAVWTAFSLAATALQALLARAALVTPMMESASVRFGGVLLLLAGAWQLTPLKQSCLASCRSPMDWLARHWRPGLRGAFALGVGHGAFCLGCCWALMLLLFAGGVMNLAWIAAITLFVLLEKLAPFGVQGGRLSGVLLMASGALFVAFGNS